MACILLRVSSSCLNIELSMIFLTACSLNVWSGPDLLQVESRHFPSALAISNLENERKTIIL